MSEWRAIVCAVDFSPESRNALLEAARLARRLGALLTVAHVETAARTGGEAPFAPPTRPGLSEREARSVAAELDAWGKDAEAAAGAPVSTLLLAGAAGEAIVRAAADGGFDAVVLATRSRSGLARAVLGSVAEHVVRHASVPVVVVPRG